MSWQPADDPALGDKHACDAIETVIVPRARDLGGFEVRRALPSPRRQMVGPFIFWDQMGPADFVIGKGIDVRPHPHIGLATATYLFEGEIMHRDSLGTEIAISPGALNLMTAGRGIAHSERSAAEARKAPQRLSGIQAWVALPRTHEEGEPAFVHHGAGELPVVSDGGATLRVIAGEAMGARSPVQTPMAMFQADLQLAAGASAPSASWAGSSKRSEWAMPRPAVIQLTSPGRIGIAVPRLSRCTISPSNRKVTVASPMCGCGRTSMPCPLLNSAGPK